MRSWVFGVFLLTVVAIGVGLYKLDDVVNLIPVNRPDTDNLRNIALILLGMLALPFALWRGMSADRSARAAEDAIRNDQFQAAMKVLGSETVHARVAGIRELARLAGFALDKEKAAFVVESLSSFVRNPPNVDRSDDNKYTSDPTFLVRVRKPPEDASDAIKKGLAQTPKEDFLEALRHLTKNSTENAGRKMPELNLLGVELPVGRLPEAMHLEGAKMACAFACYSTWDRPNCRNASFQHAVLTMCTFNRGDFDGADFRLANLSKSKFLSGSAVGAQFAGACFSGTKLDGVDLSNASFSRPSSSADGEPDRLAKGLTQQQLDTAFAAVEPRLDGVKDAKTGKQLVWRGQKRQLAEPQNASESSGGFDDA